MTRRLAISLVLLGLIASTTARAGIENAGTTGANFLSVGSGASILSMGGATLGLGSDLNAVNWNVAALGGLAETQFALSHTGLEDQSAQEWAAVGGRFGHTQTRWALSGLYQSDGAFDGRDAFNNPTGSFGISSMALGMQVAQPFGPMMRVGGGFKWVGEHLGDISGSGLTFDAGVQGRSGIFGFGLAAQNLGGNMKYQSTSAPFPSNVGMGVAVDHPSGVRVALDANFPSAYYKDVRMGAEWNWRQKVALRAGYRKELGAPAGERLSGPSFGLGSGASGVWVDYGYVVAGGGGAGEHRIGLSFRPSMMNAGLGLRPALEPTVEPAPTPKAARKPKDEPKDEPKAEKRGKHARETAVEPVETLGPPAPKKKSVEPSVIQAPKPVEVPAVVAPKTPEPTPVVSKPVEPPVVTKPVETPAIAKPAETPAVVKPIESTSAPKPIETAPAPKPAVALPIAPPAPKPAIVTPPAPAPAVAPSIVTPAPVPPAARPIVAPPSTPATVKPVDTAPATPSSKPEAKSLTPVTPPVESPKPGANVAPPVAPKPEAIVPPISTAPKFVPSKPAPAPAVAAAPATPVQRPAKVSVKRGETMASIAKLYGTSVAAIMMENNFVTDHVKPGQTIKLPKAN